MKKKRNTTSRLKDLLAILICLSIATYSLWLFWLDFNAVMEKIIAGLEKDLKAELR